jgi:hypothetical protein
MVVKGFFNDAQLEDGNVLVWVQEAIKARFNDLVHTEDGIDHSVVVRYDSEMGRLILDGLCFLFTWIGIRTRKALGFMTASR